MMNIKYEATDQVIEHLRKNGAVKLCLVDGNSLLYSSFFGLSKFEYSNGSKLQSPGINGALRKLYKYAKERRPDKVVFIFDTKEATEHKKKSIVDYKANRKTTPDSLKDELMRFKVFLVESGFEIYQSNVLEGDDILGRLISVNKEKYDTIDIISRDNDMYQFINDKINVWNNKLFGVKELNEKFRSNWVSGLGYLIYKSIIGDKSDNLKGQKYVSKSDAIRISEVKEKAVIKKNSWVLSLGCSKVDDLLIENGIIPHSNLTEIYFTPEDFKGISKERYERAREGNPLDILDYGPLSDYLNKGELNKEQESGLDNNTKLSINKEINGKDAKQANNDSGNEANKDKNNDIYSELFNVTEINNNFKIMNMSYGVSQLKINEILDMKISQEWSVIGSNTIAKEFGIIWFSIKDWLKLVPSHINKEEIKDASICISENEELVENHNIKKGIKLI